MTRLCQASLVLTAMAASMASPVFGQQTRHMGSSLHPVSNSPSCVRCRAMVVTGRTVAPTNLYSYGSNVDSPSMALVHEKIAERIDLENHLREKDYEADRRESLGLPRHLFTSADASVFEEHYDSMIRVRSAQLDAQQETRELERQHRVRVVTGDEPDNLIISPRQLLTNPDQHKNLCRP